MNTFIWMKWNAYLNQNGSLMRSGGVRNLRILPHFHSIRNGSIKLALFTQRLYPLVNDDSLIQDEFYEVCEIARRKIVKYIYDELPALYDILESKEYVRDVSCYGDMPSLLTDEMLDIHVEYESEDENT